MSEWVLSDTRGIWVLNTPTDAADRDLEVVWQDDFLKLSHGVDASVASYCIRPDLRRSYTTLTHPKWIMLSLGDKPEIRTGVKGARLWRDKHVIVHRYGRTPRVYLVVAR